MNNQTALLKVARNQVYFQLRYDRQFNVTVNRENVNISSDIHTVPIGLVISVQPSIDTETGQVLLYLRPTITRFSQTVADPAVDIARAQTTTNTNIQTQPSLIPVVEVQEFETVMRLRDGETGLLGGLMEIRTSGDNTGLPGLEKVRLFESTSNAHEIIELVFIVRAKIVKDGDRQHQADQRLYNLVDDPRPIAMI
jgi:general secretion pathway protein D